MKPSDSRPLHNEVEVERGERLNANLPGHGGPVGFVAFGESAELAYQPTGLGAAAAPGFEIEAGGELWAVTGERVSNVPGMRVLLLRKVQ